MSKRRKARTKAEKLALPGIDLGPHERWRHDPVLIEKVNSTDAVGGRRARVYSRNPLQTYFRRRVIDERQKSAGEVLGRLWLSAAMEPRLIGKYEEYVDASKTGGAMARKSEAYERWRRAIAAVGPIASDEIIAVCCIEEPVNGAAEIEILCRGLTVLAKHFGV